MMNITQHMPKLPFAMTALCLMLTACGGGSNNIAPSGSGTGGTTSNLCASSNASCVDVVFDDTPVVNLNFECGIYHGVTGNTGVARCPLDSTVTFFLKSSTGTRKVTLGSYSIKEVRATSASESIDTSLIRIGVKDLAENTTGVTITSLDNTSATTAINLSRFIQSLGLATEPYIDSAPVNRIFIHNNLKDGSPAKAATATTPAEAAIPGLDILTADVTAKDFEDATFETKLKPWLDGQKRSLLSATEAKRRLAKTIFAIKSGVYYSTPVTSLSVLQDLGRDIDLGISGNSTTNVNNRASTAVYTLTDRSGASIGYGMQWTGTPTTSEALYKLFTTTNFAKMRLPSPAPLNDGSGNYKDYVGGIDPFTSRFSNALFNVSSAKFVGDQDDSYQAGSDTGTSRLYEDTFEKGQTFTFVNGKMFRDLGLFGSSFVYNLYLNQEVKDQTELGTWEQRTKTGSRTYSGNASLFKSSAINTYLDPDVWRVKDLVSVGQGYLFPLYATLTFTYSDAYVKECAAQGKTCSPKQDLNVVFLENGDIMTNFNRSDVKDAQGVVTTCTGPITKPADLPNSTTAKLDQRIGTVRAAFLGTSGSGSEYYFSPSILLSGKNFGALDGVQIGTSVLSPRVKINIAGIRQLNSGAGSINVTSAEPTTDTNGNVTGSGIDNIGPASWGNGYNAFIGGYVAAVTALIEDKETTPKPPAPPAALKLAATQTEGLLSISTASCYRVLRKTSAS